MCMKRKDALSDKFGLGLNADKSIIPFNRIDEILPETWDECSKRETLKKNGKKKRPLVTYVNEAYAFDIETTSAMINGVKVPFMYVWQMYFNGEVVMGRDWDQLREVLQKISDHFEGRRVVIYVHNLGFEFSFLQKVLRFNRAFFVRPRYPLYAIWKNIEFRDSLALSGLKLENLGTKTKKLKGDLDYSLPRHLRTPLTYKEIQYCKNDVIVLAEYIREKMKDDTLATIPLTRTGFVRRDCRERMKKGGIDVRGLELSMDQYNKLRQLFAGGFTHAAGHTSNQSIYGVRSLDLTSSYPTVMVAEFFPMSKFVPVEPKTRQELLNYLNTMCCMMYVEFTNLRPKEGVYESIISRSKVVEFGVTNEIPRPIFNNGRVVKAGRVGVWLNEVDFRDVLNFYDNDGCVISDMEVAIKGRLPKPLVEAILYYYQKKTELKGLHSEDGTLEALYGLMKQFINGIYGSTVTTPLKDPIFFSEGEFRSWQKRNIIDPAMYKDDFVTDEAYEKAALKLNELMGGETSEEEFRRNGFKTVETFRQEQLDEYNKSRTRYLFYAWGVWTTSYARHNLFTMMRKVGIDYHYSDTDSLKITNYFDHKKKFDAYNRQIVAKLREACRDHGLDPKLVTPEDKNGIARPLGVWTDEGEYFEFKTLGAKRYMVETSDGIEVTVAGMNKHAASKYFASFEHPFEHFNSGAIIPADQSKALLHTFCDKPWEGMFTDYLGIETYVYAPGGTHLMPAPSSMEMSPEYLMYLATLENEETGFIETDEEFLDTCC